VLLQTGLLLGDGAGGPRAALAHNRSGRFIDRWVRLEARPSNCLFLQGIESTFDLPIAHGEGRFVTRSAADLAELDAAGQLALRYAGGPDGNPNGAMADVAGACDSSGRVFGLMPHPERFIDATQHPAWNGRLDAGATGAGLAIFASGVRSVS
jgi:phosphoribosylformylglycinamidine synthase